MKALTLVETKKFEVIEKDIPEVTDGNVVIKVHKTGICGSDIHMIWQTGYNAGQNFVIGHEFCGTIYDAGNSKRFKKGDRVVAMEIDPCMDCDYCRNNDHNLCGHVLEGGPGIGIDGGYGQYVLMREDMVLPLPENVSDISGSLVEPAAISMHGVKLASVSENSNVLITGGGAIGLFAAACSRALGAKTVALMEINKERLKIASDSLFVDFVIDASESNLDVQLKELVPDGFDAVIECSGNKQASTVGLNSLKRGGHMSIIAYGEQPDINIFNFVNNEYHISGSLFFKISEFEEVIQLMSEGKLDLEKFVKVIKMNEVQGILEKLEAGIENNIKYVIDINGDFN